MTEIGCYITGQGEAWGYGELRDAFVEAERLGFDAGWTMDNCVGSSESTRERPVPDTWTVLPAIAEATKRIRLGPLVTPVGRRPFALFAKTTSVFDQISGGRLDLGLGAGDHADYFVPWGQEYPEGKVRVAQLREQIEVLKLMWSEPHADYDGEFVTLRGAINEPKPVQKPHPPIWIGLTRSRTRMPRLAARYADGINIYLPEPKDREMLEIFERCCEEIGRDPGEVRRSRNLIVAVTDREIDLPEVIRREADEGVGKFEYLLPNITEYENPIIGPAEHCIEEIRRRGQGFDQVIVNSPGLDAEDRLYTTTPAGTRHAMHRFAEEVMPELRAAADG